MRKLSVLTLIAGLFVLFTSCSKPDQHLSAIPSSAQVVASVDLFNIARKAELYDAEQYTFVVEAMEKMKAENPEMHAFVQELMKNPLESGLKFREDLYMFVDHLDNTTFAGATLSIRNSGDFEKTLNNLLTHAKTDKAIVKKDGLNYVEHKDLVIVYDDKKALVVTNEKKNKEELSSYAKLLMTQSEDNAITSLKTFNEFKDNTEDFSIWVSSDDMPQTPQSAMLANSMPFKLTGNYIKFHTKFEDNGIFGTTKMEYNDEIAAMLKEYELIKTEFNTDLLEYLPEDNYMTYGMAINPTGIYKWLNDIPSYKAFLDDAKTNAPLNVENLIKSIEGDIIIALHGFQIPENATTTNPGSVNQNVLPLATAIMSLNDRSVVDQLIGQLQPTGLIQEANGVYTVSFFNIKAYFGIFDNNLIFSNDESIIAAAQNGGMKNNLKDTDLKELFAHPGYMYMNLNWEKYPMQLTSMLKSTMSPKDAKSFLAFANVLKEIRAYNISEKEGRFEFLMRNTDGNSLHTLLKAIDESQKANKKDGGKPLASN
ncbi:MAG: DUF4836 family protein [Salinivirgaceae bacterium]